MERIEVRSCAKINFGLRVLEQRNDGFHNLFTLFLPIKGLFDNLSFEKTSNPSFSCNVDTLTDTSSNLVIQAKKLLEKETDIILNVKIKLDKRIPIGAGLGGGSSNAAATLIALNSLFDLNLSETILQEMALQLGSDVPFFLSPKPSIGNSRGEQLQFINFPINYSVVLINPGIHISTKEAFAHIIPRKCSVDYFSLIKDGNLDFSKCRAIVKNDFENYIFKFNPEIKKIKDDFYKHDADFSQMSGTGSTVYGIFNDRSCAENALKHFPENYFSFLV